MPVSPATLQALESAFTATRVGPELVQPGQPVRVRLSPSALDLHVTDLLPGELSLTWITKSVRFNDHRTEPALAASPFNLAALDQPGVLEGGMPARAPLAGNIVGTEGLSGVPGQLAQLAGTVPISVEVPVDVHVEWAVHDEAGATVASGPATFSAPQGTVGPDVSFVFAPQTVELTADTPTPTVRLFIRARVTLSAGATQHPPFPLPDIPVVIPAIAIPTVVVFFVNSNFAGSGGAAFIVVPDNSQLKNLEQLQTVLNTLQSTLAPLTSIARLAAFLLGIQELSNALSAQPHVQFRVTRDYRFNRFDKVRLIERDWAFDTQAEDSLSSMIFIGPRLKVVECFNARNTNDDEGHFTLTIGPELHALVRHMHAVNLSVEPAGAIFTLMRNPPGGLFNPDHFGDNLSSMRFSQLGSNQPRDDS